LVGVIIIFFYGPPQPSFFPYDIITDDNIHREILDMRNKYNIFSKMGLGFIFIGFLMQLFAAILSDRSYKKSIEKIEDVKPTSDTNAEESIQK
jgi:hypothetical protein